MLPLVFLGGLVAGAVGMVTLSRHPGHGKDDSPPVLEDPENMDVARCGKLLGDYIIQAEGLYSACNKVLMASDCLAAAPVKLSGDGLARFAINALAGKVNGVSRGLRVRDLLSLRQEAADLYNYYLPVFIRACSLLSDQGLEAPEIPSAMDDCVAEVVDNDPANGDWDMQLEKLAWGIRHFLDNTCVSARELQNELDLD